MLGHCWVPFPLKSERPCKHGDRLGIKSAYLWASGKLGLCFARRTRAALKLHPLTGDRRPWDCPEPGMTPGAAWPPEVESYHLVAFGVLAIAGARLSLPGHKSPHL